MEIFRLDMKELLFLCAIAGTLYWGYSESEHSKQLQTELDQMKVSLMDTQQRLSVLQAQQQQAKKGNNGWMWNSNSALGNNKGLHQ